MSTSGSQTVRLAPLVENEGTAGEALKIEENVICSEVPYHWSILANLGLI